MMRLILYITAHILFLSILHSPLQAQGVITVRVSFKVILNPADGARPTLGPSGAVLADADVDTTIAAMNDLYRPYFRGFRFQRVGPVIDVGGIGDMTGPSRYFNTNFVTDPNRIQLRNQMEEAAMTDGRYAWNNNAINVYVNGGTQGGYAHFLAITISSSLAEEQLALVKLCFMKSATTLIWFTRMRMIWSTHLPTTLLGTWIKSLTTTSV